MSDTPEDTTAVPQSAGDSGPPAFKGLSTRQCQAVEAMLREPTLKRVAATAGVNERTLRKWLARPRFKAIVLAARREAFGQAVGLSQRYAPMAVATLVKVMQDTTVTPSARVTAAALLLRFGREGIQLDDLITRIEALEQQTLTSGTSSSTEANP